MCLVNFCHYYTLHRWQMKYYSRFHYLRWVLFCFLKTTTSSTAETASQIRSCNWNFIKANFIFFYILKNEEGTKYRNQSTERGDQKERGISATMNEYVWKRSWGMGISLCIWVGEISVILWTYWGRCWWCFHIHIHTTTTTSTSTPPPPPPPPQENWF